MPQRYKFFPLLLLVALLIGSCEADPTGSNGVPNSITGKVVLINSDENAPFADHSGVTIALRGTAFSTTSTSAGEYTLNGIPPGVYVMTLAKPECDSAAVNVEYSGVGVEFLNPIQLRSFFKINRLEGVALLMAPFDSIRDHSGINVNIEGTALTTTTDVNGRYKFVDPPKGLHKLSFTKPGFDPTSANVNYTAGVAQASTVRLYSQSWIVLDSLIKGMASDFVGSPYADSISAGLVYFGGVGVPTYRPVLLVLGRTKDVPHQDIKFELMARDTQTFGMEVGAFARKSNGSSVMLALDWGYVIEYDKYFKDTDEFVKLTADVLGRRVTSNAEALPPR